MKRLLLSCFGLGWLPIAPGTWGSLPPTIVLAILMYANVSQIVITIVMLAFILTGSIICVRFAPVSIAATGKTDPGEVVVDEVAGQTVTFLAVAFLPTTEIATKEICIIAVAGFLLFRVFDIIKPWPVRKLESLPAGWGILADDLMAGVYAAICLYIGIRFWLMG